MKTTIFAKRVKTREGKSFTKFVTSLEHKDGTRQYMNAMYSGDDKNKKFDPADCPMVIEFERDKANVSTQTYIDKNGDVRKNYTLWIKDYRQTDEKYVDNSLDDYI